MQDPTPEPASPPAADTLDAAHAGTAGADAAPPPGAAAGGDSGPDAVDPGAVHMAEAAAADRAATEPPAADAAPAVSSVEAVTAAVSASADPAADPDAAAAAAAAGADAAPEAGPQDAAPTPGAARPGKRRERGPRVDIDAVAADLKARFPALFGGTPRPIKLRIQTDIQERAPGVFSKQALSLFLHRHTTSTNYLIALSEQPHRVDLDGQPAGEVAAEHRDAAAQEVERRRALRREREAQFVEARRAAARAERERLRQQPAAAPAADGAAAAGPGAPTPPRPPRPDHERRAPRDRRGERSGDRRGEGRGDGRAPERADRPAGARAGAGPERRADPRVDGAAARPPRGPRPAPQPAAEGHGQPDILHAPSSGVDAVEEQARRDRARLLREFDSSPLTPQNFSVLKRIAPDVLQAQLAQARQEAAAWAAAHPRPPRDERAGPAWPRGDRARDDRPRGDRPRGDPPRGDRPRADRPGGERPRRDGPRHESRPPRPGPGTAPPAAATPASATPAPASDAGPDAGKDPA